MESWIRLGVFVLILFSFLRRIINVRRRPSILPKTSVPRPSASTNSFPQTESGTAPTRVPQTFSLPKFGTKKNDFRDVPPPPENPQLG